MTSNKIARGFKIAIFAILGIILFTWVVMALWNWLIPDIFGLREITMLESAGLLILSKILFGGFHKSHKSGKCGNDKHLIYRMNEKWSTMSPEEKEKFKNKFKNKCGNKFSIEEFEKEFDEKPIENSGQPSSTDQDSTKKE